MRFFSSISVINIVKSKRILLKMRIKTDVAVTVLNRYCDITYLEINHSFIQGLEDFIQYMDHFI